MLKEFKEFALKGSLLDTAIAFVMGAAFGKVVTAFVEKMFAPLTGLLMGGLDLSKKAWTIKEGVPAVKDAAGVVTTPEVAPLMVEWGSFVTACIDFLVVAFVMFMIIKAINKMKRAQEEAPAAPSSTDVLLGDILSELKKSK